MGAVPAKETAMINDSPAYARFLKVLVLAAIWTMAAATGRAATLTENFATNPLGRGWQIFGDTNLFLWNAADQNLSVTWDSSRPNSYFYLPLGTILNRQDDFGLELDLKLTDIAGGVDPNKPSTFELAFGWINLLDATRTNFFRGNPSGSPNLVELDFFPNTGFGPTIWPSIWSTNSSPNYNGSWDYTLMDLPTGVVMRISLSYTASNQTLTTAITTNGVSIGPINAVTNSPTFTDFRVGAFAVASYSDAGQDPQYGGSLLAHGVLHSVTITVPLPVENLAGRFMGDHWQVQFLSRTDWLYTLERTADFQSWTPASAAIGGNGTNLVLPDTNALSAGAFYRVRAERL